MSNHNTQPDYAADTYLIISGQLTEWGIDFNQDRVSQLTPSQRSELQSWINKGVDADDSYQADFASLPEFMESELLEMTGELASDPQETIIEQAINAYESNTPITGNPYLFDTTGWHLWRQAYCRWHRGESLDFTIEHSETEESDDESIDNAAVPTELIRLAPRLLQVEQRLKKLRRKIRNVKVQRKQILSQLSHTLKTNSSGSFPERVQVDSDQRGVPQQYTAETSVETQRCEQCEVISIPVCNPESNRIEILLWQDENGEWCAGHRWSVEIDTKTGQRSSGSSLPKQSDRLFKTQIAALIDEVLKFSRIQTGNTIIGTQVIEYLNLLEEYPGQFALCSICGHHWLSDDLDESEVCPQCLPE